MLGLVLGIPLGSPDTVGWLLAATAVVATVATPALGTPLGTPGTDCCRPWVLGLVLGTPFGSPGTVAWFLGW